MGAPEFWNNSDRAQKHIAQVNNLKRTIAGLVAFNKRLDDANLMVELIESASPAEQEDYAKELTTLAADAEEAELRRVGHEFGAVTGRPRRCGWFDAVVARYAARVNGLTALAVTKLDVLDGFDEIPVAVSYQLDGHAINEMPADVSILERLKPVYEVLPGWRTSTADARTLADLPANARAYLARLESLSDTPIRYVSVGTRRDQIIETR